jgi:hypothetical protein
MGRVSKKRKKGQGLPIAPHVLFEEKEEGAG